MSNKKMEHTNYIYTSDGFAIIPIKTIDMGWIWFKKMFLIVDERPLIYNGLLEKTHYYANESNRNADYVIYQDK